MPASIPASRIVNVLPNVITAGGSGLDLVGLILTTSAQLPIGVILSLATAADVSAYFGPSAQETALATTYFAGYDGSTIKPAKLMFYRYASTAQAAFLRGGSVAGLTLAQLQALSGTLTINVTGSNKTSSAINLSAATSFSNAATIIQAAFTSPGFTVAYDSISGGFVFTHGTTGAAATLSFATGTLSAGLKLTAVTGAVLSPGADVAAPGTAMDAVIALSQDFVSFTTTWKPVDADKLLFAARVSGKNNRFAYVPWDDNAAATNNGDTTSFGPQNKAAGYNSVAAIYDPANGANIAAGVMGYIASLDFKARNGRATMAFRNATGQVVAGVTNQTVGDNLNANGYNFVGLYATANSQFTFLYNGQISGKFAWLDSWACQVWLNNGFQLALMNLLTQVGQVPYNSEGYALIEQAMMDMVNQALYFGAIRAGVTLSSLQKAQINNAAGAIVADVVQQRGWYIKVADAPPDVRAARGSPPIYFWYTDGGSVHQITLSSVLVQ
jgi:hypothetical protein